MQCGIAARGLCLNEMLLLWIQIVGNGLLRVGIIRIVLGICRGFRYFISKSIVPAAIFLHLLDMVQERRMLLRSTSLVLR